MRAPTGRDRRSYPHHVRTRPVAVHCDRVLDRRSLFRRREARPRHDHRALRCSSPARASARCSVKCAQPSTWIGNDGGVGPEGGHPCSPGRVERERSTGPRLAHLRRAHAQQGDRHIGMILCDAPRHRDRRVVSRKVHGGPAFGAQDEADDGADERASTLRGPCWACDRGDRDLGCRRRSTRVSPGACPRKPGTRCGSLEPWSARESAPQRDLPARASSRLSGW